MKKVLAILACGLAVGGTVYGMLRLSGSQKPPPSDPWIGAFREEGLQAGQISISNEPGRYFLMIELRDKMKAEPFSGTRIYEYRIEDVRVQVATFPFEARIEELLEEGPHYEFKLKEKKGNVYHYTRVGPHVLVMNDQQRSPAAHGPVPRALAERILRAFAEQANQ